MAEAQLRIGVDVAQNELTFGCAFAALVDGLAAATNAAARTSHNLDEIVIDLAVFDGVAQVVSILETADDGNGKFFACQVVGYLAPAFATAYGAESIGIGVFAGDQEVGAAKSRLHYAAGGAEDVTCASGFAQGHVELFFG